MRLIMCLFLTCSMCAQTAKVIPLDKQDSDLVKALNTQLNNISKQLNEVNSRVKDKYLLTTTSTICSANRREGEVVDKSMVWTTGTLMISDAEYRDGKHYQETEKEKASRLKAKAELEAYNKLHPMLYYKDGWDCGQFQYSDDYKYIAPLVPVVTKPYGFPAITN